MNVCKGRCTWACCVWGPRNVASWKLKKKPQLRTCKTCRISFLSLASFSCSRGPGSGPPCKSMPAFSYLGRGSGGQVGGFRPWKDGPAEYRRHLNHRLCRPYGPNATPQRAATRHRCPRKVPPETHDHPPSGPQPSAWFHTKGK